MFESIKNFFGRLFSSDNRDDYYEDEEISVLSRDSINMRDAGEREEYVKNCIDQINDAQDAAGELTREYSMVTAYLTDMEEIEALPPRNKKELKAVAEKIVNYEKEKNLREESYVRMPEPEYNKMQRMENEAEEGIKRLKEVEDYQEKIRGDLRRLSGERHAYMYRRHDLGILMVNLRGMIVITAFAFITCMAILLILKSMLRLDIRAGYILTAVATVLSIFFIYMKYSESVREQKKVEAGINRLILLQNRVKIRYVNNTNLLDYLYVKYQVSSSEELVDLWEAYLTDRDERLKMQELYAELEHHHKELIRMLRELPIKYPHIWINQAYAIGDKREMVEIRHSLILRRQKLRDQMDHNEKMAQLAQEEIKSLIEEYPEYSAQIIEQVSRSKAERDRLKGAAPGLEGDTPEE